MKPELKPPGTKRLKLKCDILHSTFAFTFNLRRFTWVRFTTTCGSSSSNKVGRCRLTLSNPC